MCHAAPSVQFMAILFSYNRSASEKATPCQLALCEFVNLINAEKYKPYIFLFFILKHKPFFLFVTIRSINMQVIKFSNLEVLLQLIWSN